MKKVIACFSAAVLFSCLVPQVHAQGLLKKLKDKVADKVNEKIGGNTSTSSTSSDGSNSGTGTSSSTSNNRSGGPVNKTGAGLTNTAPPDVLSNISAAESAGTDYSKARYALQQAMMGVEIQLGRKIIQMLPNTVDGLTKDTTKNVVSSTQFGWNNMVIQTVYGDGKDKQMTVSIGNLPLYAGLANLYFNNAYGQTNMMDNNPNIKQVQLKGERAVIQFDENTGYSLMTQLGQGTVMTWQCVNFATEDEVMKAANEFDIAGIKKMMGEQ